MLVNINSVEKVKEFVHITSGFDFEVDLISGRFVVDAKSIMGIFSLDLSKPIELVVPSVDNEKTANDRLRKFECNV